MTAPPPPPDCRRTARGNAEGKKLWRWRNSVDAKGDKMPYKNIEDKRTAWRRWKAKNAEKHKENQRIQSIAIYSNFERRLCSIEGCTRIGERHHPDYSKPKEIIWLCKQHHEDNHHKEKRVCSIDGCVRQHMAGELCHPHYKQRRRKEGKGRNGA